MNPKTILVCAVLLVGCGGADDPPPVTSASDAPELALKSESWKGATVDVGKVAAVTELEGTVAVFSSLGVSMMAGGVVAASDGSVRTWSSASTIPSADGRGSWIVAVDGEGKLRRLRGDASMEDVSDRYGLLGKKVTSVASIGGPLVAFSFDGGFAVADGKTVDLYSDASFQSLAGGSKRVVTIVPDGVKSFDPVAKTMVLYPLAGAAYAAFDPAGRLVVATKRVIYVEHEAGVLTLRHKEIEDVHGLVTSGPRVWFTAGGELGVLDDGGVHRSRGANVPFTAKLLAAADGDVWTLDDGTLQRFGVDADADIKERTWSETIRPVFERACSKCHLPGGTAGVDLSSYRAWAAHATSIEDRVVVRKQMPPAGNELSDVDRAAIAKWVEAQKK